MAFRCDLKSTHSDRPALLAPACPLWRSLSIAPFLLLSWQSLALCDYLAVGGVGLLSGTYSFTEPVVVTQAFRVAAPNKTTRIDFLLGGNGQGTLQVDVLSVSLPAWNLDTVATQTFLIPDTGLASNDALNFSIPFQIDLPSDDQVFLLSLSATDGTAFIVQAQNTFQFGGGVGQTHSTTLPITDPNQGFNLPFHPMMFQVYGEIDYIPEPSTIVLVGSATSLLAFVRARRRL